MNEEALGQMTTAAKRQVLFTPGPLMTTDATRQAMLVDYGSRDQKFLTAVDAVRSTLLAVANLDPKVWAAVLLQGAGTMGIEACISTTAPRHKGKYLLLNSGKYAERQLAIAKRLQRDVVEHKSGEGEEIDFAALERLMTEHADVTNVGYVFHETSTGMVYPAEKIASLARKHIPNATIIVDAISGFGAIPIDVAASADLLITSSNKCFHGVPGFSIVLARRAVLSKFKGNCTSLVLDLERQLAGFDKNGQFLVTPPVHCIMAFDQALKEYVAEGGLAARQEQYRRKAEIVVSAAKAMGFDLFLEEGKPSFGNIVICLKMPTHPKWNFKKFYQFLNQNGFVIYPGKASHAETFRFGLIGATTLDDMRDVMRCSKDALAAMGIANLKTTSKL